MTNAESTNKIIRVIKFVNTGERELMKIYLQGPNSKDLSLFSAYVNKQLVVRALSHFKANFDDKGDFIIFEDSEDEILRKLVVFAGVIESIKAIGEYTLKHLLEFINHMTPVELLFWFSRFVHANEDSRWSIRRVAKAFRILYGF